MPIAELLGVMAQGIKRHETLLAAALPRVASEALVVAIAAEALLRNHYEALAAGEQPTLDAIIDRKYRDPEFEGDDRTERRDLIVTGPTGPTGEYHLEFKCLWPGGTRRKRGKKDPECPRKIKEDLVKLSRAPLGRAYVVAFAYVIEEAPPNARYHRYQDIPNIDRLLDEAGKYILRKPNEQSSDIEIKGYQCQATARLVAWTPDKQSSG